MSNKVIFNLDELFISVGIDVGADFSWMSIALPNQQFVGKPYKILHNSIDSLTTAVSKIKEAEELYSLESRIFLESTGIYHSSAIFVIRVLTAPLLILSSLRIAQTSTSEKCIMIVLIQKKLLWLA
jgi:hypothetical protein